MTHQIIEQKALDLRVHPSDEIIRLGPIRSCEPDPPCGGPNNLAWDRSHGLLIDGVTGSWAFEDLRLLGKTEKHHRKHFAGSHPQDSADCPWAFVLFDEADQALVGWRGGNQQAYRR